MPTLLDPLYGNSPEALLYQFGDVLGSQEPRFWTAPPRHREKDPACPACQDPDAAFPVGCGNQQAAELLEWAPEFGYELDEWQDWWLTEICGTTPEGKWAAREGMLIVSRQNGKNTCLEVRELAGLFVFSERMIIHTAHEFKAAAEHFRRVRDVITEYDELRKRVKAIVTSHGEEAIELKPMPTLIFGAGGRMIRRSVGARLRFLARSRGSGRSFTADLVVYDEAKILSDEPVGASMPTMSAVANPQMI
jgi:phage terminase large subunit-like protein